MSLATSKTPSLLDNALRRAAGAALLALLIPCQRGQAQLTVFDPTNFARNVLHYARRLEQMDLQRQQLEQQLAAMRKLPNPPWRDISQTVAQINALMADGRALSYQLANLDQQFRTTFPVGRSFVDWPTERRAQAERTVATMGAVLAGARAQAQAFNDGLGRVAQIKAQVGSIQGHEAALELQNSATVLTAEELILLRQALIAQSSMQAVYYSDRVNAEAQQSATIEERLSGLATPARRGRPISLRVERP